jgi:uncharacterized protein
MKFTQDDTGGGNIIQSYAKGRVVINGKIHQQSLIVTPSEVIDTWRPADFSSLTADDLSILADLTPEIVILGTGESQRFPAYSLSQQLITQQIGIESMATAAACRTYNILMGEGRRVVAALFMI